MGENVENMDKNTRGLSDKDVVSVNDFLKFRDTILKGSIKENSSSFQTVDFSRNNFNRLFPWSRVETPIESVKFGEGQFAKFSFKERRNLLAAVYETLVIPDIIIEEERFNEFNEPATSHNYAKNFIMDLNSKMIQSVVVEIENSNIIITSHERPVNEILNKIKKADQILYLAPEVGLLVRQKAQNGQSMADQNLSGVLQGKTSFLNKAYNYNETKSINYMLNEKLLTNNEVLRYSKPIGLAAAERINTVLTNDRKRGLEPSIHKNDTLEELMRCIGDSYGLPEEATKKRRKAAIQTLNKANIVFEKYSEYLERNDRAKTEQLNMTEKNGNILSWNEIHEAADGAHWNDNELSVKNRAREQAVEFASEIGEEINGNDENNIESFIEDYGINFLQDGTMAENIQPLRAGEPISALDHNVNKMLAKFLEEESEINASDSRGKEFTSNFSRERFADGDLSTIIGYANHLNDGSALWALGARVGNKRQLYYRDPTQSEKWQKATVQEFFDFVGDFYAHNYQKEFDEKHLSMMRELFSSSKDLEKLWEQNFTKNDMQPDDLKSLSDHSAHGEIWSHLPDIEDDHDSPTITLENAIMEAENYLENHADELNDEYFGKRADSTEEKKNIRNEFFLLLKNVNDVLHSDEFLDNTFLIDNATAENLDLLHAEVLKVCAELAKEDFLSSFGEIIDGEYPNQEDVEYRRQTLNDLRVDMKNLDNYLDDNASRLLENIYETARHKGLWLFDFIEATVDTSDPSDEHKMEWNRALEELLDGYTDYKDFNEKWDVSLTPTSAKFHWLESEKDLIHIAFNNAFGNDSVEVPYGAESYKDFLDSIDFEKRFSLSNLLRAETLQMNNEKSQEKNIAENKDIERLIQQKNKPTAVNPINRRDSNELSENEPPSTYYDRRLVSICQVPQMPYLEMVNGKWRPKQEAIKAVEDGKVFLEKNGQIYVMHDESFLEEKSMEKEERKLSKEEFERLSNLLGTATDSEGQDFKAKFNAKNQDTKQIVATLLHETRESEEAYALSPSYFDFESEEKDGDGYDMRWNLYENIAEKIISDKTITNMEQVENLIEEESFHLEEEYNKEHNITQNQEYQKEEQFEQEWPGLATWKELADVVGKDIYVYKDDVLENNKGISEKEWKTEALARTLNDGILDLRGFDTESTSKINSLQYDSDFMKSIKGEVYKAINPEKWDVLEKVAEDTVDEYSPEITELTVDTLQIRYDEKLSEDHVYLEAVEKGLVEIDRNMAERILKNNNPHLLEDGVKIAIVKASFEKDTPEWEKPERFIVTPHDTLPDNYTDEELAAYLTDNRINSTEPKISEKQASIISYYFMRNDYALYIDQKGNLSCVDFSEDFNTEDIDVMTNKDLLLLTEDLIDKDIGFKDRAEEDLKEIQNVLKGYEKGQTVQKTQSPQELYDSFIGKVEKEFKELKLLRVATKNTIKTLSPEDKKIINEELKKRGAKTPESLALVVKESIEKRNKNKTRKQSQNKEKDYFERER